MTRTTGTAYNSVWVSDEYPKAVRSSPYSALGRLFPMNRTASEAAAAAKGQRSLTVAPLSRAGLAWVVCSLVPTPALTFLCGSGSPGVADCRSSDPGRIGR
jgi:hypothetical protein